MSERVNECSAGCDCYTAMVQDIKQAINAVASIYPTAFDLYDEPLDRLAHRLGHLFRDKYGDSFSVEEAVRNESVE